MFLRSKKRWKDGKTHRYFSVVENRRVRSGRVVQRQVLFWERSTIASKRHGAGQIRSGGQVL